MQIIIITTVQVSKLLAMMLKHSFYSRFQATFCLTLLATMVATMVVLLCKWFRLLSPKVAHITVPKDNLLVLMQVASFKTMGAASDPTLLEA